MFVAATFQITSDHYILGACYFAAATCFACSANIFRKKGNEEEQKEEQKAEQKVEQKTEDVK